MKSERERESWRKAKSNLQFAYAPFKWKENVQIHVIFVFHCVNSRTPRVCRWSEREKEKENEGELAFDSHSFDCSQTNLLMSPLQCLQLPFAFPRKEKVRWTKKKDLSRESKE
jgi:hypothetical protein